MSPLLAILVIVIAYFVIALIVGSALGRILKSERKRRDAEGDWLDAGLRADKAQEELDQIRHLTTED